MILDAELAIVGDGAAAYAAAITAAGLGLDVCVIGRASSDAARLPESMTPEALPLLRHMGLSAEQVDSFPRVAVRVSRWGLGKSTMRPSIASPLGGSIILGKNRLCAMLRERAQACGVRLVEGSLQQARQTLRHVHLQYRAASGADTVRADYAIDASGRAAILARRLGAVRKTFDQLVCFWISGPAAPDARLQHVTVTVKDGWMFCIAGPDDIAHAALFAPGSSLHGKPDAASIVSRLLDEPEAAAMMRDPAAWHGSAVHVRNAASSALDRIGGERWLACGDALQTVDPLSSQGVFTALEQGGMAARAIAGMRGGNGENRALYAARIRRSFQDYNRRHASYYGHPASP